MIVVQPVLDIGTRDGFALWPVAEREPFTFMPLHGTLSAAEIGTAVMTVAAYNNVRPDAEDAECPPARPGDPVEDFLRGLLTEEDVQAPGGLRVTDTARDMALLPGCCNGLEEWRDWLDVLDGAGHAGFGHDPSSFAERHGDVVRLTVDAQRDDSPVLEVPVDVLRTGIARAERDLAGFLRAAAGWAAVRLPAHAPAVATALARSLDMPPPGA
ncbi:hypothetical protein [Streptomyces sp. NPDC026673]|uniref:hypothetical protein n=1 Tax=Streptomyces sp. NPDC026673 TaxID=3155724 RepID=UPI0033F6B391